MEALTLSTLLPNPISFHWTELFVGVSFKKAFTIYWSAAKQIASLVQHLDAVLCITKLVEITLLLEEVVRIISAHGTMFVVPFCKSKRCKF